MVSRQSPAGSTLERALRALEKMEAKLVAAEQAAVEPLAIVGMGCRFPGGATDPDSFWHLLRAGTNAVTEVPASRWGHGGAAQSSARWAGLLDDVDMFDAAFFGLGRQDVADMDPQHRLLLEVAWQTLENGGITTQRLATTNAGIFVGLASHEYSNLLATATTEPRPYVITGNADSFAASRIAYFLNLRGPCLSIDTACSSSLVALHLACQSLRRRECDMILVGGANLLLSPETSNLLSSLQILSHDGLCRTFDSRASGYVRAEGVGFVVVERLSDAQKNGDRILAILRGSAITQNGRGTSLTAPNIQAQVSAMISAHKDARVTPEQIGYMEVHSNGSPLGDSVEIEALREAVGKTRKDGSRCVLGSVKSNIGHAEAASGMASLIKAILVLNHEIIPKNLHFESLNPNISLDGTPFVIPTSALTWKKTATPRLAGVSASGLSGTNVHVILQEPPPIAPALGKIERPLHVFTLSARSSSALREHAKQMLRLLAAHPEIPLGDQCHTLGIGRVHFDHRFSAVVANNAELKGHLTDFIDGAPGAYSTGFLQRLSARRRCAFLFSGKAMDVRGMLGSLGEGLPALRDAIHHADNAVFVLTGHQVAPLLQGEVNASSTQDPVAWELALFVFQYALVELWKSWGFEPSAVAGEGTGECIAIWAAGMVEFADALSLAIARAQFVHQQARSKVDIGKTLSGIHFTRPKCAVLARTGEDISFQELTSTAYWERKVTVADSWEQLGVSLATRDYEMGLEMGPVMTKPETNNPARRAIPILKLSRANHPSMRVMLEALVKLYAAGFEVDWKRFDHAHPYKRISLPTYPFQRQRYWFGTANVVAAAPVVQREGHTLLGRTIEPRADQPDIRCWEMVLDDTHSRAVGVQRIASVSYLASGGIVEVGAAAAREIFGSATWELSFTLGDPPVVEGGSTATMQIIATPQGESKTTIGVFYRSRPAAPWKRAAQGIAAIAKPMEDIEDEVAPASIRAGRRQSIPLALWGHRLETLGVQIDAFHVEQIWRRGGETLARVSLKTAHATRSVIRTAVAIASITQPAIYGRAWMVESAEGLTMKDASPDVGAWLRVNWNANNGLTARIALELVDDDGTVVAAARNLDLRAQDPGVMLRAAGEEPLESALVDFTWKETTLPTNRPTTKRKWLIVTDKAGVGKALAAHLQAAGDSVFTLPASEIEKNTERFDITMLVSGPFHGVVYLGAMDLPANDVMISSPITSAVEDGPTMLLRVVQSLAGLVYVPRLWIVTAGAQPIENPRPSILQAGFWGMGRVLSMERSDLWGGMIDLEPTPTVESVEKLAAALLSFGTENHIALRNAKAHVARLARIYATDDQPLPVRPDRTYLITGVDTPFGAEVANWLVDRGAKYLVFAAWRTNSEKQGNGDPSAAYAEVARSLTSKQVTTTVLDLHGLAPREVQERFARLDPPLAGVVHAAGAADCRISRLTSRETLEPFREALEDKGRLLWTLYWATQDKPLQFFVTFASAPSTLGWEGFGADAIASEYADTMARIRSSNGVPTAAIHVAFANEPRPIHSEFDQELLAVGFQGMSPPMALNAIDRLLSNQKPVATLAWMDWSLLECAGRTEMLRPLLEGLADGRTTQAGPAMLQRRVAAAEPEQARRIIDNVVRTEVRHVLSGNANVDVSNDQDFASLGMDSIMGVQVLTRVGRVCGVHLPVTLLLAQPTINSLSERIVRIMRPQSAEEGNAAADLVSRREMFVEFNREAIKRPLFFAPPLTGSGLFFQPLVNNLPPDRPFCALDTPGLEPDTMPSDRVEVLAGRFVDALRQRQPHGPYLLGGYSFGVLVAYEMAQILTRAGERVAALVLVDLPPPIHGMKKLSPLSQLARLFNYSIDEATFDDLGPEEQAERITFLSKEHLNLPPDISESSQQMRVYNAHLRALQAYVPKPYRGSATIIRSHETIQNTKKTGILLNDDTLGWGPLCSEPVRVHDLPGDHLTVVLAPELARIMQSLLEEVDAT
jgi:acyl transferase domain-containing protein/thioesterase domain-containing protein